MKYSALIEYKERYAAGEGSRGEKSILNRMLKEIEWKNLSENEKQEKRIEANKKAKFLENYEDVKLNLLYEESVISLYNLIEGFLLKVTPEDKIFRVKFILEIEKMFVNENEDILSLRHMDYYVLNDLFKEVSIDFSKEYEKFDLELILKKFNEMYSLWNKRPYKDI